MSFTKYFRKTLAVQMNPRIDIKDDNFIKMTPCEIAGGYIDKANADILFREHDKHKKQKSNTTVIPVLIVLKTVKSDINDTVKDAAEPDDLSGFFILPAELDDQGNLSPSPGKTPWFVREFMSPMVEPEICIGASEDVDSYLIDTISEKAKIDSWDKYWMYSCKMYEYVTHSEFYSDIIGINNIQVDHNCYILCDKTVNASYHIINLYDTLISSEKNVETPLYNNFISVKSPFARSWVEDNLSSKIRHCGQMGGQYPLSRSQREALNHLNASKQGDILAVSGPPGTGKTTLLQSVVADLITQHVIKEMDPPIIVAASTNNQAVTNIIDSFGKINSQGVNNLEKRWITVAHSFATYFPSRSKEESARTHNYQICADIIPKINSKIDIAESSTLFFDEFNEYFSSSVTNISNCKQLIRYRLLELDKLRIELLKEFDSLMSHTKGVAFDRYKIHIKNTIENIKKDKNIIEQCIEEEHQHCETLRSRMLEWNKINREIPWYIRLFSFIPKCKKKIINHTNNRKNDFEISKEILQKSYSPKAVLGAYQIIVDELEKEIYEKRCNISELDTEIKRMDFEIESACKILMKCVNKAELLRSLGADLISHQKGNAKNKNEVIPTAKRVLSKSNFDELNNMIDVTVRYVEFWLAVHYYECSWLESDVLTEKQLDSNIVEDVKEKFKKLAMISPCMVMTFFMLPMHFRVYNKNEKVKSYLYNYIDLLIVDEAGQTSPEIAAASFALAKRAIVVGDEKQIEPVWGIPQALDIALAKDSGVIMNEVDFNILAKCGLNASESSVMKVASQSCPFNSVEKQLFLSEHRRCYDEIISYCNALVYNNKLEPCRGKGAEHVKRPIDCKRYPIMGYFDIYTDKSLTSGSSRTNLIEATKIAEWLQKHYEQLCTAYIDQDSTVSQRDILAIITPFKAQVNIIKNELKNKLGYSAKYIDVGTVHTFQGGERRIIIFSPTYGALDSFYFIEKNTNLMNVAVSRAKDAFWVFGCYKGLERRGSNSASGLLSSYIKDCKINI